MDKKDMRRMDKFCRMKMLFFELFFCKFPILPILIGKSLCENSTYKKIECTTTKATENPRNLSSQNLDFWTFVTYIFLFQVCHIWSFSEIKKKANVDKPGSQNVGPSLKPRSKSICEKWSSVCVLQSWLYHILHRTLHFGAILSYRFDQFLNSEKINIFDETQKHVYSRVGGWSNFTPHHLTQQESISRE